MLLEEGAQFDNGGISHEKVNLKDFMQVMEKSNFIKNWWEMQEEIANIVFM